MGAIVIIRRDPAITVPDFELLSLPEAMIATIPETSALPKIPMPLARLARALCQGGGPYRLVYSEIADCVDVLIGLTEGPPAGAPASPEWEHLPDDERQPLDTPWTTVSWDSVVTRAPWNDAVASEGEVVVLHDHVPSLLNRLGGTLWRLSGDRMSVADLHTRVVEDIGGHPRSNALVLEALQSLVDGGMMQIVDDPAAADR